MRNWRVRSRLLLLVTIPTVVAIGLGAFNISSSLQSARSYQQAESLARLSQNTTALVQALEEERDQTAVYIALPTGGRAAVLNPATQSRAQLELTVIHRDVATSQQLESAVRSQVSQIGSSYPAQTQQAAASALTALNELPYLRKIALNTHYPVLTVVQKYTQVINSMLALNDQVAQGVGDPALAQAVHVLGLVSAMKEEASEQRAILSVALLQGQFSVGQLTALDSAQSAQAGNLTAFDTAANVGQRTLWNRTTDRSYSYLANSEESQALSLQSTVGSLRHDPTTAFEWYGAMSNTINYQMGAVEQHLAGSVVSRAAALRRSAIIAALIVGAVVLLVLLLALISTALVGRSMVRPLRRLRAGALDVAGVRLPEEVRQMSETGSTAAQATIDPIDVGSSDEIGEVARAFDQVHREALRLAATEAALRGNVNAMFVNLSRRSQSLIERQIKLIDNLEQSEQDSERLGSLFQMDHLATRMRRNSENLLVLAGHDMARRWNQPIALVDVLRAAVSEIEQYERVSLNVQPGISVRGQAVNDVVHLTAELVENATSFSPADSPVAITGHLLGSGGVLLEITDTGVGMGTEEMAHANWRLDNPPVVDVAVSRRMGLYVVARLAARHGIRVRLRPAPSGGLTALVWLPDETIRQDEAGLGIAPGDRWTDGGAAGTFTSAAGDWNAPARSVAEQEVNAARTPRFTPLQADEDASAGPADADSDLDQRVPGAGPRPGGRSGESDWSSSGNWSGSTGPMPVFRTSPQPASREEAESGNGAAGYEGADRDTAASNGTSANGTGPATAAWPAAAGAAFGSESGDDITGQVPAVGQDADPEDTPSPDADEHAETAGTAAATAAEEPGALPKRDTRRSWRPPEEQLTRPSVDMFGNATSPAPAASEESTPPPGNGQGDDSPIRPRFAPRFAGFGQKAEAADAAEASGTPGAPRDDQGGHGSNGDGDRAGSSGFASPSGLAPSFGDSAPGDEPAAQAGGEAAEDTGSSSGQRAESQDSPAGSGAGTGGNGVPGRWSPGSSLDSVVIPPAASMAEQNRLPIFEQVESDWFRRGRPPVRQPAASSAETNGLSPAGDQAITSPDSHFAPADNMASDGVAETAGQASGGETGSVADPAATAATAATDADAAAEAVPAAAAGQAPAEAPAADGGWSSPADEGWRAAEALSEPASGGLTHAGLPKRVPRANLVPGAVSAEGEAPAPVRSAAATRDRLASFQRGVRQARAASGGDQAGSEVSDDGSSDS